MKSAKRLLRTERTSIPLGGEGRVRGFSDTLKVGSTTTIGGGGIRTPETLSSLTVFKTVAFVHSATPPKRWAAVGPGVDCSDRLLANRAGYSPCALAAIRDNLPPKLRSGEIRISDAEQFMEKTGWR